MSAFTAEEVGPRLCGGTHNTGTINVKGHFYVQQRCLEAGRFESHDN